MATENTYKRYGALGGLVAGQELVQDRQTQLIENLLRAAQARDTISQTENRLEDIRLKKKYGEREIEASIASTEAQTAFTKEQTRLMPEAQALEVSKYEEGIRQFDEGLAFDEKQLEQDKLKLSQAWESLNVEKMRASTDQQRVDIDQKIFDLQYATKDLAIEERMADIDFKKSQAEENRAHADYLRSGGERTTGAFQAGDYVPSDTLLGSVQAMMLSRPEMFGNGEISKAGDQQVYHTDLLSPDEFQNLRFTIGERVMRHLAENPFLDISAAKQAVLNDMQASGELTYTPEGRFSRGALSFNPRESRSPQAPLDKPPLNDPISVLKWNVERAPSGTQKAFIVQMWAEDMKAKGKFDQYKNQIPFDYQKYLNIKLK